MPGKQHEVNFRFLAQPTDVNFGGKVHGGMVMKWIDQAGYACAVAWSGAYCVTASVSGIQFVKPILIGDLVTVRARLIHTDAPACTWPSTCWRATCARTNTAWPPAA